MLGIFITILGITYIYNTYYSECADDKNEGAFTISLVSRVIPEPARMIISGQRGCIPFPDDGKAFGCLSFARAIRPAGGST